MRLIESEQKRLEAFTKYVLLQQAAPDIVRQTEQQLEASSIISIVDDFRMQYTLDPAFRQKMLTIVEQESNPVSPVERRKAFGEELNQLFDDLHITIYLLCDLHYDPEQQLKTILNITED